MNSSQLMLRGRLSLIYILYCWNDQSNNSKLILCCCSLCYTSNKNPNISLEIIHSQDLLALCVMLTFFFFFYCFSEKIGKHLIFAAYDAVVNLFLIFFLRISKIYEHINTLFWIHIFFWNLCKCSPLYVNFSVSQWAGEFCQWLGGWKHIQTVEAAQQLKFRLHYQLQDTEGLSVPHGWTASWFSHIFPSSALFPLFFLCCLFVSLPTTLLSDYSPAPLSIFSNPFVQISQACITLSQLLICDTSAFAVTRLNLYRFCTTS